MNSPDPAQGLPIVMAIWPGQGARLWTECQNDSLIRVGWDWFRADLGEFKNFTTFKLAYDQAFASRPKPNETYDIPKNLWDFRNLNPGALVLAIEGRRQVLAVGQVTGHYTFRSDLKEYRHAIPVTWGPEIHLRLPMSAKHFPIKAATVVPPNRFKEIFEFPIQQFRKLFGEETLRDRPFQVMASRLDQEPGIDLSTLRNEEERQWAALCVRRGQSAFRNKLIGRFHGQCPVTGCDAEAALEAAHIVAYAESGTSGSVSANGILLRSDIHALFDRGLLSIDPGSLSIQIADGVRTTVYIELDGHQLRLPPGFPEADLKRALVERKRRLGQ